MITVTELAKIYRTKWSQVLALRGTSCVIRPGELTVVFGPSGSGKSTFLRLLAGLDRPDAGSVRVDDLKIADAAGDARTAFLRDTVGFVFQSFNLLPGLTAKENVQFPLVLAGKSIKQSRERAEHLLEKVGLGKRFDHYPHQLSGGEQQRVATAVALANDPKVIIADEPTAELDSKNAQQIVTLLSGLAKQDGKTVVVATHDPAVLGKA
ncbi:MAG TPA: ABC transporter ATP-binding protein, partial [Thermoplasmata archaeon]|nr:ABC transporter ATP-binding protein [Thermoplasmata archaeon]